MKEADREFLVVWGKTRWHIFDTETQVTTGNYATREEAYSSLKAIEDVTAILTKLGDKK